MGYNAVKHDEFTSNEAVNKAVLGLSIIRLFIFFIIFLLNLNQSIQEFIYAKIKNRYFTNARLLTYISITIYPMVRVIMICVFFNDKTIDNGSKSAAVSIWATLFQYYEFIFIGCFWIAILLTFFTTKTNMVAANSRRVWIGTWIIVFVIFIWTIIQTVFNFYYLDLMSSTYGPGQIVIVVGIGSFYLINGVILIRAIRKNSDNIPELKESYNRITRLATALIIMILGVFILYIVQTPIMGFKDYDTENYAFYLFSCLLEFTQLSIVMYSLGGDSYKKYLVPFSTEEKSNSNNVVNNNMIHQIIQIRN